MKTKAARKTKTLEIMEDGLKSPASVQAPMTLTKGMPFEQVSLMFSQMQQMLAQMQKQNEQMHLILQLLL